MIEGIRKFIFHTLKKYVDTAQYYNQNAFTCITEEASVQTSLMMTASHFTHESL